MQIKSHITDRQEAIDACENAALETGRKMVLMEYIVGEQDGYAQFTHCVVSQAQFFNLPCGPDAMTLTPHGPQHLMYAGWMFGSEGRL